MANKKKNTNNNSNDNNYNIDYCGYKPNEEVCLRCRTGGINHWVKGYTIFDPNKEYNVTNPSKGGYRSLNYKHIPGTVPLISGDILLKPVAVSPDRIKKLSEVQHPVSFDQLFNQHLWQN